MMWKNKKLIYDKQGQLPTPFVKDSCILIFYSWRKDGISHIGKLKFDYNFNLLDDDPYALLPGERGSFDDSGVMPSCIFENHLFYSGWHLRKSVPYSHAIGVCQINENEKLERIYSGPVFSTNKNAPCLVNSPFVYSEDNKTKMIYCAGTHWDQDKPCYHLRIATSSSNFNFIDDQEYFKTNCENDAISRCCIQDGISYFSIKKTNSNYEIFSMEKNKLIKPLIPKDELDRDMQCYPYLFQINGRKEKYMLYNGNGYGATGIFMAFK